MKIKVVVIDSTNMHTDSLDPIGSLQARDIIKARLLEEEPLIVFREPRGAILWRGKVVVTKHGITLHDKGIEWGMKDIDIQKQFPEGLHGIICHIYYEASKLSATFTSNSCDTYVVTYHTESGHSGRVFFWGTI